MSILEFTTEETWKQALTCFPSPAEFLDFCEKINVRGDRHGGYDHDWYGNEHPTVCFERARRGHSGVQAEIDAEFARFHRLQQLELEVSTWTPAPFGAYPVVGDYLAGSPECMRRVQRRDVDTTGIRVVVDTTSSAAVHAKQLFKRGLAVGAFVRALSAIRPVELFMAVTGDGRGGISAALIQLPSNPMDISICAWALGSQRLTRGFGYDFIHRANGFSGGWPFGQYEHHRVTDQVRSFLQMEAADIYIPPINLDDALIKNPYAWLDLQLRTYLPEKADAWN